MRNFLEFSMFVSYYVRRKIEDLGVDLCGEFVLFYKFAENFWEEDLH